MPKVTKNYNSYQTPNQDTQKINSANIVYSMSQEGKSASLTDSQKNSPIYTLPQDIFVNNIAPLMDYLSLVKFEQAVKVSGSYVKEEIKNRIKNRELNFKEEFTKAFNEIWDEFQKKKEKITEPKVLQELENEAVKELHKVINVYGIDMLLCEETYKWTQNEKNDLHGSTDHPYIKILRKFIEEVL